MRRGFTLIELVMVIVILGILAAVAIPKFYDLTTQAKQAATLGALGGLKSAVSLYYANYAATNNGATAWPTTLAELQSAMADGNIPKNAQADSSSVTIVTTDPAATATGGWIYNSANGKIWAANDLNLQ